MIIAIFKTCYYIIYEKCLNVIICEEIFLFMISLQTHFSIYADKNYVLFISDMFSSKGNLCFLHKIKQLSACDLKIPSVALMYLSHCYSQLKYNLTQWQSVLPIGMINFSTVTLHEFYQTSMSSYKCLFMIIIIQSEFTNLGNLFKFNF